MNDIKRKRLEKRIVQTIALVTQKELKNPHVGFVTFVRCELSPDGEHAKVYVSIYEEDKDVYNKTLSALQNARGFFRKKIASVIPMRVIPQIHFIADDSLAYLANLPGATPSEE